MKFRNKVLSVLLAAGMVASMPAATAFNVMADDAVVTDSATEEADLLGGVDSSNNYESRGWTIATKDDEFGKTDNFDDTYKVAKLYLAKKNATSTDEDRILVITRKTDNSADVKVYSPKDEKTPLSDTATATVYTVVDKVQATCEAGGTAHVTINVKFDKDGTGDKAPDKVWKFDGDVTTPAQGHKWEYNSGTWTWTKSSGTLANGADNWTATYTYKCLNGDATQTKAATIDAQGVYSSTCAYEGTERYIASVTLDDGNTYYYTNNDDLYKANIGKEAKDQNWTKVGTTTDLEEAKAKAFIAPITKYYHTWTYNNSSVEESTKWNTATKYIKDKKDIYKTTVANADSADWRNLDHYLFNGTAATTKDNPAVDDSTYTSTTKASAPDITNIANTLSGTQFGIQGESTKNHYYFGKKPSEKANVVTIALKCDSVHHYTGESNKNANQTGMTADQDGPTLVYVPAYVVATSEIGCEKDATDTYKAYIFASEDEAKAVAKAAGANENEAAAFYKAFQIGTDGKAYAASLNDGKNIVSTKVDTWEGTRLGHHYDIKSWVWAADQSYIDVNFACDRKNCSNDKLITVRTNSVKLNKDGKTASVSVTYPNQRKNPDDAVWYGKNGWLAKKSNEMNQKTQDFTAFSLKNSTKDAEQGMNAMERLFNTKTGEHLYTCDANEIKTLTAGDWKDEGIGWYAPVVSNTPVFRMYNKNTGAHVYTVDSNEVNTLSKINGWNYEGIAWYSDDDKTVPVYRQFNSKATDPRSDHNYTTSAHERKVLTTQYGWNDEGIAWYAAK